MRNEVSYKRDTKVKGKLLKGTSGSGERHFQKFILRLQTDIFISKL